MKNPEDYGLEPGADNAVTLEGWIKLSTAISLKRIADALDTPSPNGSVLYWLAELASQGRN